jgi:heat shock protein HtpX
LLVARNLLKDWARFLVICALLGGIGWVLNGYGLFLIFVFAGLLVAAGMWWYADRAVLGLVRARELTLGEAPGLHSTVERLAAQAGVVKPRLYLMADGFPRACSAGRGPRSSAIAVSRGLLQALPPAEVEAVLAHEFAHIRHRDVFVQSVAVVTAGVIVEASRIGGRFRRGLLVVLGPVGAAFIHLLLSPKREFEADRAAASLCGSPHGLAAALLRLDRASDLVQFEGSPVAEPLYPVNPYEQEGLAGLFATHPPVGERVRRLRALDPEAPAIAA